MNPFYEILLAIYLAFSFQQDLETKVDDYHFKFFYDKNEVHASCNYRDKAIYLNSNHWKTLSFYHKRELIYHELGHCALNLKHPENNNPAIMRPRVYSTLPDGSNWEALLDHMRFDAGKFVKAQ